MHVVFLFFRCLTILIHPVFRLQSIRILLLTQYWLADDRVDVESFPYVDNVSSTQLVAWYLMRVGKRNIVENTTFKLSYYQTKYSFRLSGILRLCHKNTRVAAMSCCCVLRALLIIVWWNPQVLFATPSDAELFQDHQYYEGHRQYLASCQNKPIEGLNNDNNLTNVTDLL